MQNVTVQFPKYPPIQGHPSSVPFSCCQITTHRSTSKLERQETPQDPVPAETVSCSWTRDPTRTVWHSVPEVDLCLRALLLQFRVSIGLVYKSLQRRANTDAGFTSAGTYIIT